MQAHSMQGEKPEEHLMTIKLLRESCTLICLFVYSMIEKESLKAKGWKPLA